MRGSLCGSDIVRETRQSVLTVCLANHTTLYAVLILLSSPTGWSPHGLTKCWAMRTMLPGLTMPNTVRPTQGSGTLTQLLHQPFIPASCLSCVAWSPVFLFILLPTFNLARRLCYFSLQQRLNNHHDNRFVCLHHNIFFLWAQKLPYMN